MPAAAMFPAMANQLVPSGPIYGVLAVAVRALLVRTRIPGSFKSRQYCSIAVELPVTFTDAQRSYRNSESVSLDFEGANGSTAQVSNPIAAPAASSSSSSNPPRRTSSSAGGRDDQDQDQNHEIISDQAAEILKQLRDGSLYGANIYKRERLNI